MDKKRSSDTLLTRDLLNSKDTHGLRVKGWKEIFQENDYQKTAGIALLRQNGL